MSLSQCLSFSVVSRSLLSGSVITTCASLCVRLSLHLSIYLAASLFSSLSVPVLSLSLSSLCWLVSVWFFMSHSIYVNVALCQYFSVCLSVCLAWFFFLICLVSLFVPFFRSLHCRLVFVFVSFAHTVSLCVYWNKDVCSMPLSLSLCLSMLSMFVCLSISISFSISVSTLSIYVDLFLFYF